MHLSLVHVRLILCNTVCNCEGQRSTFRNRFFPTLLGQHLSHGCTSVLPHSWLVNLHKLPGKCKSSGSASHSSSKCGNHICSPPHLPFFFSFETRAYNVGLVWNLLCKDLPPEYYRIKGMCHVPPQWASFFFLFWYRISLYSPGWPQI